MRIRQEVQEVIDSLIAGNTQHLVLNWCFANNQPINDVEIDAIANLIRTNNSIEVLVINGAGLDSKGVKKIADALKENTSITEIFLVGNNIGSEGAPYIADVLSAPGCKIETVCLNENKIGDQGAETLAQAIQNSAVVKALMLRDNEIGDAGAKAIGDALKRSNNLLELTLNQNYISIDGLTEIAAGLTRNKALKTLDLSNNTFVWNDDCSPKICNALKVNKTLEIIYLNSFWHTMSCYTAENLIAAGINLQTGRITRTPILDFVRSGYEYAANHKKQMFGCAVALCALGAICYKKPELLVNFKDLLSRLCEKVSGVFVSR